MTLRTVLVLIVFLLACFATASIGGLATAQGVRDWYPSLHKPAWTPPAWLFGPVWTILYIGIAMAGFLAWRRAGLAGAKWTMGLFVVQLILNAAWSWVFFGLRQTGWAMVEVALLWGTIVGATVALFQVSIPAGLLFVPYMAWVSFASVLNFAIWRLNRGST